MRIEGSGYTGFLGLDATSFQIGQNSNLRSMTFHSGSGMPERMRIDSSGRVGIGTIAMSSMNSYGSGFTVGNSGISGSAGMTVYASANTGYSSVYFGDPDDTKVGWLEYSHGSDALAVGAGNAEAMRIDSSGSLLHGTTSSSIYNDTSGNGVNIKGQQGQIIVAKESTSASDPAMILNDTGVDSSIIQFSKDGSTVGSIGTANTSFGTNPYIAGSGGRGLSFDVDVDRIFPCTSTGARADGTADLGASTARFNDIYATNGTIQTSDRNEKQDIAELSDAEQRVAVAAKGLMRKFRWRDAVEAKGDEARTHFGIIAQDLQAAFAAEGLDAGDYAMFISSTWTDEETGEERTRMGVRYSELLAFIIAAI